MLILEVIKHCIAIVILAVGSFIDIKIREFPDSLSFTLIIFGLFFNLFSSIVFSETSFIINSLIGFGIIFLFSSLLFYTKQWGGGDAKLVTGLAALDGLTFKIDDFFINFIFLSFFIGAFYGFLWLLTLYIKKTKNFLYLIKISLFIIAFILLFIFIPFLRYILIILLLLLFIIYFPKLKKIEEKLTVKKVNVNKLREGDWVYQDVKINDKMIYSKDSYGISKRQIALLKKSKIKYVKVKEGMPFIPSFFIAYIISLFFKILIFLF